MTHARRPVCGDQWFTLIVMAFTLAWVCGCGGSSAQKILYAVGLGTSDVTLFSVSSAGTLTNIASVGAGSAPSAISIDPLARFAYVLDSGGSAGGVSQYVLNRSSGGLTVATFSTTGGTPTTSTPAETGVNPKSMAIDSAGVLVFVANQGLISGGPTTCSTTPSGACPSISVYCIDPIGGTLTEVKQRAAAPAGNTSCSQPIAVPADAPANCAPNNPVPCPLSTPAAPTALVTTGKLLLVAMTSAGSSSVATYTFDSKGSLAPNPFGTSPTPPPTTALPGVSPSAMTVDPGGRFLFVADSGANTVAVFSIGTSGQLTTVGAPISAGTTPVSIRVHPSGRFLYTANRDSNDISAFSIDGSGTLKAVSGSPFPLGRPGPSYVTTDSSGSLLFVAASLQSNTISVFSVDASGALKEVTGSPFNSHVVNPVALASIN